MHGKRLFYLIVTLAGLTFFSPSVLGQSDQPIGLTVSPVTAEFAAEPGTTVKKTIKIVNSGSEILTLYPKVYDFHTDNEDGKPKLYSSGETYPQFSMSEWVEFSKPLIRVAENEQEDFEILLNIPEDAEPGGHYGAVMLSTDKTATGSSTTPQVNIVGLVGTLLIAQVPGDIVQNLEIDSFSAPSTLFKSPANFSLTFENLGNTHVKPTGEVKIRNKNGALITSLPINQGNGNVLPKSKRRFDLTWKFDWKTFGTYTATTAINYGNPPQQLQQTKTFTIIPFWAIGTGAGLIILITTLIILLKKRRKKQPPQPTNIPPIQADSDTK